MERLSARCSRRSTDSIRCSVGSMSKATSMMPDENRVLTSKPAARNTPSIGRLSGSTSAVKRVIPSSRATAARCSSITVAMPRP